MKRAGSNRQSPVAHEAGPSSRNAATTMPTPADARRSPRRVPGSALRTPRSAPRGPLPYVIVSMAMTADGKISTANRIISSFGSRRDHERMFDLRATADAVLCGAATAGGSNITLGPGPDRFRRKRLRRGLAEYNLRVVVSGSGHLDPRADLFRHHFSPVIVLTTRNASHGRLQRLRAVADEVAVFGEKDINLITALHWLRKRWRVKRLVCEGGGRLNDAMFRAGLVDELHLTVCPKIFGGRQAPTMVGGAGFARLAEAARLRLRSRRRAGNEMFLVYEVLGGPGRPLAVSTQRASSQRRSERRLK